jgi:prevent-host-death family protein
MPEVGVRELKARASEILRNVRDRRSRYVVTLRGRPVGILLPLGEAQTGEVDQQGAWDELARLGKEISRGWQSPLTSTELLSEMRR